MYFIEKFDNVLFQVVIFMIVIFAEIAWVIFEDNTMKKKMIKILKLQDIQIRLLPATVMYSHYLNNTKLDIRLLKL